jgi:hypothetical protein
MHARRKKNVRFVLWDYVCFCMCSVCVCVRVRACVSSPSLTDAPGWSKKPNFSVHAFFRAACLSTL